MKSVFVFCGLLMKTGLLLIAAMALSCNEPEHNPVSVNERNVWKDAGMRPPEPVIVQTPQAFPDSQLPAGTYLIAITEKNYMLYHNSDSARCENISILDSVLRVYGDSALDGHLALQIDGKTEVRIDSVIDLLKAKKIIHFNLITDLVRKR